MKIGLDKSMRKLHSNGALPVNKSFDQGKHSTKMLRTILAKTKEDSENKQLTTSLEETNRKNKNLGNQSFSQQKSEILFGKQPEKGENNENGGSTKKSQITTNLGNLKVHRILENRLDLAKILEKMSNFYKNMEKSSSCSVMSYLSSLFGLFQDLANQNPEMSQLFLLVNKLFSLPIERIIEQFIQMLQVYKSSKELSTGITDFFEEKRKFLEQDKSQKREIRKLNDLLESGSFSREKEAILLENSKLKSLVKKQRKELSQQRSKDEKIMRLLNAIRGKGVNLEEIYRETVSSESETEQVSLSPMKKPPLELSNAPIFSFRKDNPPLLQPSCDVKLLNFCLES